MQPCAEERTARALTFGEAVDGCPLTDVVLDLAWDSLASVTTLDELSISTRCAALPMLCSEGWLEGFTVFYAVPRHMPSPSVDGRCLDVVGGQDTDGDGGDQRDDERDVRRRGLEAQLRGCSGFDGAGYGWPVLALSRLGWLTRLVRGGRHDGLKVPIETSQWSMAAVGTVGCNRLGLERGAGGALAREQTVEPWVALECSRR